MIRTRSSVLQKGNIASHRTSRRVRRGAAAVEFALVSPVLILLFLGMFEFGRMIMVYQSLTNASREGARQAVTDGATEQGVKSLVVAYLNDAFITVPEQNVVISPNPETAVFGDQVTVQVAVDFDEVSWLPMPMLISSTQLQATTIMRREGYQ